jgi:hypothetical protein
MPSTNLKTIWLTIRATNYTTQVFTNVISNMNGLIASEKKAINSGLNLGKSAMAAGILFSVMGSQIGGTAGQLLTYASYGMYAVSMIGYLKAGLAFMDAQMRLHHITVATLTTGYTGLAVAISAAIGTFAIVYSILNSIRNPILDVIVIIGALTVALWALFVAESAASWGIALAAGGAAAAGAVALATQYSGHATGTRMVGATGPALLHRGEVVYNPSTGRPTQVGNDLASRGGGFTTIDASMHIDTLNTKASEEELNEILRKQGRKIANDRR